ncbi:MAG: diguanylate cyclase [Clostridia bacterium]|nr:diguanylate cyclase [Clostridia bacterium]
MKKRFEIIKTIQLLLFMGIAAAGLFAVFTDDALYQMVGRNPSVRTLCLLLWLALGLAFVGIYWDFSTHSSFKRAYRELDFAVYNDHIAGIANRYSCDAMIEKYMDKPMPDTLGCVMLDLLNIREINSEHGHAKGNEAIQAFSAVLHTASLGLCFVARNGGNKFMALFENCDESKINTFLSRVGRLVEQSNAKGKIPHIEYRTGRALSRDEHVDTITQLIALTDRRLTLESDRVAGVASRTSCDEIIGAYLDKPLPPCIGCVMLEIANIREINETRGHLEGNRVIRQFGDILRESAAGLCFVGRNGGTKFLALFEECDKRKLAAFIAGVEERTRRRNALEGETFIACIWGQAFDEGPQVSGINQLVALSDKRMREKRMGVHAGTQEHNDGRT